MKWVYEEWPWQTSENNFCHNWQQYFSCHMVPVSIVPHWPPAGLVAAADINQYIYSHELSQRIIEIEHHTEGSVNIIPDEALECKALPKGF